MKRKLLVLLGVLVICASAFAEGQTEKDEKKLVISGIVFQDD